GRRHHAQPRHDTVKEQVNPPHSPAPTRPSATPFSLPPRDLNPQEGIWLLVKRTIGNLAAANLDQLVRTVKLRTCRFLTRGFPFGGSLV
ncbi:hypothetical protein AB0D66_33395, partial [Streptomyces sp. NPDC048270]